MQHSSAPPLVHNSNVSTIEKVYIANMFIQHVYIYILEHYMLTSYPPVLGKTVVLRFHVGEDACHFQKIKSVTQRPQPASHDRQSSTNGILYST